MHDAEVIVIGGGAAGLSLLQRLGEHWHGTGPAPRVVCLHPSDPELRPAARTWCFFEAGAGAWDHALTASWPTVGVIGASGRSIRDTVAPFAYKMLRSDVAQQHVLDRLGTRLQVTDARATAIAADRNAATVRIQHRDGSEAELSAPWVIDTRPAVPPPARAGVLQSFFGWFVRSERPDFDPAAGAVLMDFRAEQPPHALAFGYVLPLGRHEALIEYTEFGPRGLDVPRFEQALGRYVRDTLGLDGLRVTGTEQGVIPMSTARYATTGAGRRVLRIGAGSGAIRPASGYTFNGIQQQVERFARGLETGTVSRPIAPYRQRHLLMDAVLLRALQRGRLDAPRFYESLFSRLGPQRVLAFLDSRTGLLEELRLLGSAPAWPMLRSAVELPFLPRSFG